MGTKDDPLVAAMSNGVEEITAVICDDCHESWWDFSERRFFTDGMTVLCENCMDPDGDNF